jgi:pimeloyl-ACP methyl ester carboxylesterase
VVVHGIGQQTHAETLLEWVEPIAQRLDYLSRSAGLCGAQVVFSRLLKDNDPEVWIKVEVDGEHSRQIRFSEARWSEAFLAQGLTTVLLWGAMFGVPFLRRVVGHLWRFASARFKFDTRRHPELLHVSDFFDAPRLKQASRLATAAINVVTSVIIGAGIVAFIAIGWVIPLALGVMLFLAAFLVRWPVVGGWVRLRLAFLSTYIGDSSAWTRAPVRAAAMRDVVRNSVREARSVADKVILLGHSQGAAICAHAMFGADAPDDCRVECLVTVGGATSLLQEPRWPFAQASKSDPITNWSTRSDTRWINIWALWDIIASGPLVEKRASVQQRWSEVYLAENLLRERVQQATDAEMTSEDYAHGFRYAFHQRTARRSELESRILQQQSWLAKMPGPRGPEERPVYNRGSVLSDHTTYSNNILQVIDPIARILMGGTFEQHEYTATRAKVKSLIFSVRALAINRAFCVLLALLAVNQLSLLVASMGWSEFGQQYAAENVFISKLLERVNPNILTYAQFSVLATAAFLVFNSATTSLWTFYIDSLSWLGGANAGRRKILFFGVCALTELAVLYLVFPSTNLWIFGASGLALVLLILFIAWPVTHPDPIPARRDPTGNRP